MAHGALANPVVALSPRLIAWYAYGHARPEDDGFIGIEPATFEHNDRGWSWIARVRAGLYQWTGLTIIDYARSHGFAQAARLNPQPASHGTGLVWGRTRGADVTWQAASRVAGSGFLLAGDAAASVDPASGRGVLRALLSGTEAGRVAAAAVATSDVDGAILSEQYARRFRTGFLAEVSELRARYSDLFTSRPWRRRTPVNPVLPTGLALACRGATIDGRSQELRS